MFLVIHVYMSELVHESSLALLQKALKHLSEKENVTNSRIYSFTTQHTHKESYQS